MMRARWLLWLLLVPALARTQEIPKGPSLLVELGQGLNRPRGGPELYLATVQLVPQWTLVPGHLRAGVVLGAFHPGYRAGGLAGGRVTLKVLQGPPIMLANSFHVHLLGEYLPAVWSSSEKWQQWVGAGVGLEEANLLGLALKVHRSFPAGTVYARLDLTFNLLHKGKPSL